MLVCHDEDGHTFQSRFDQNLHQLFFDDGQSLGICGVHNEDETIHFVVVVFPKLASLTADIPQGESHASVLNLFDVQADGWHCLLEFIIFQLEEKSGLACIVEP